MTQDVFEALTAFRAARGLPTMSMAVGEALREWALARAPAGLKPLAEGGETPGRSPGDTGLKPSETREVILSAWQEARGLVTEVRQDGQHLCVVLADGGDLLVVRLPYAAGAPRIAAGSRVAILRTDTPPGYAVRPLG